MDFPSHTNLFASAKPSYAAITKASSATTMLDTSPIDLSNKGGYIAIKIDQEVYEQQLAICQYALIARIVYSKGDKPWKLEELKPKLLLVWGLSNNWKLISLGRGYYNVILNSCSDKTVVWSRDPITFKPGILRLQPW